VRRISEDNHEIYQLFAEADLATTIRLQRLKWAGHLQRMEESRGFEPKTGK